MRAALFECINKGMNTNETKLSWAKANPEKVKAAKAAYRAKAKAKISEYNAEYRAANEDRLKAKQAERYASDPERFREISQRWRRDNPDRTKAQRDRYRAANPEKIAESRASYYADNRDEELARSTQWTRDNRETVRARNSAWKKANPDKVNAANARRRATKRDALCPTRDDAVIEAIYARARWMTEKFGVLYHVDHLIPLTKGGLHHEDNLVVMRADMNTSKGDKIIPALIEFFGQSSRLRPAFC